MRIILVGFGVVGQSIAKMLHDRTPELVRAYGVRPRIVAIADRGGAAVNPQGLEIPRVLEIKSAQKTVAAFPNHGKKRTSGKKLIEELDAEVVIEATPTNIKTGEPGLSHITTALKNGRHTITTNKAPLALALPALMELAQHNHVLLRFSGTVGGGTPVLDFAKKCLLGDRILGVKGILNGTTNYILTKMSTENTEFSEALKQAQAAGYAEADPSNDIDGIDTASKLVIIANWVLNRRVTIRDVAIKGIRDVTKDAIKEASRRGEEVKLIGSIGKSLEVSPQTIPKTHPLCVSGVLNAVTFTSEHVGEETIVGPGAGGPETASAVIRDMLEIKNFLREH